MNNHTNKNKKPQPASGIDMQKIGATLKNIWDVSSKFVVKAANVTAKSVTKAAATTASATKYKVNELSNNRQRSELVSLLGEKVNDLAKSGTELPAEVAELLAQITTLEADMDSMRAEHQAAKAAAAEEKAAAKAAKAAEKAGEKVSAAVEAATEPVDMPAMDAEVVLPDAVKPCNEAPNVADVPTLEVKDEE